MDLDFFQTLMQLDEEAYLLAATNVASIDQGLQLKVEIRSQEDESVQKWKITCVQVRDHAINLGFWDSYPELSNEHVLLWAHQKPVVSLYFHGCAGNVNETIGLLYARHYELMGHWIPFARWLNPMINLGGLLCGGYGLLAEGPEPLILSYNQIMMVSGFNTSLLSRPPKYWNGQWWVDEAGSLVVLTCGKTYVVASEVQSERLPS